MKLRLLCGAVLFLELLPGMVYRTWAQAPKKMPQSAPVAGTEEAYRGGLVSPPLPKPKFTLIDTSAATFDFASKTKGYVTLLYFGYTHCPDMCPIQMGLIEQALKKLPSDSADQVK